MLVVDTLTHQNIYIRRNNNFLLDIQYKPNGVIFSTLNLTLAYLQIRPFKDSPIMYLEANTINQYIKFSGADGGIHVNIPYDVTRDLPGFDEAFYDLVIYTNTDKAVTILEGRATLEHSVARVADQYKGSSSSTGSGAPVNASPIISWEYISDKPIISLVGQTGKYDDLLEKPFSFSGVYKDLQQKPVLAKIATTGSYLDLEDLPNNYFSGNYADLTNKKVMQQDLDNSNPAKYYAQVAYREANLISDGGCVGDGATNDTPKIQALTDAVSQRGGGKILVPPRAFGLGVGGTPNVGLILRNGVVFEGLVSPPVGDTASVPMVGSVFKAISNLDSLITQANIAQILHTSGFKNCTIDAGNSRGIAISSAILISGVNIRISNNIITNGSGNGLIFKNNATACWINWIESNHIEKFAINCRFEGTDSYISNNYISFARSIGLDCDGTGGNRITGNMIDNAGKNAGNTAVVNVNAVGLSMTNTTTIANGPSWNQCRNQVIGNYFAENAAGDILIPSSPSMLLSGHTIMGNEFHFINGNSIFIGLNNRGGNVMGNDFSDNNSSTGYAVSFASGASDSNCPGWSLGPNTFSNPSYPRKYINQPPSTMILGYQ